MSFELVNGDMFSSKADTLVNTVNCVGVMGKGLAKQFAIKYPEILEPYKQACSDKTLVPGKVQMLFANDGKTIFNFPTKNHWRNPSNLVWIESAMHQLNFIVSRMPICEVIALPPLGCGLGGLEVDDVLTIVKPVVANSTKHWLLYNYEA